MRLTLRAAQHGVARHQPRGLLDLAHRGHVPDLALRALADHLQTHRLPRRQERPRQAQERVPEEILVPIDEGRPEEQTRAVAPRHDPGLELDPARVLEAQALHAVDLERPAVLLRVDVDAEEPDEGRELARLLLGDRRRVPLDVAVGVDRPHQQCAARIPLRGMVVQDLAGDSLPPAGDPLRLAGEGGRGREDGDEETQCRESGLRPTQQEASIQHEDPIQQAGQGWWRLAAPPGPAQSSIA